MRRALQLVVALAFAGGFFVSFVPEMSTPAAADEVTCQPPSVPVEGPNGQIGCSGEQGPGPGEPGPGEPEPEPPDGTVERHYQYEKCTPNNPDPSVENPGCGGEVKCTEPDVPTNVYWRNEIYYHDTGWQPVKDTGTEAGDWWTYDRTECRPPAEPTAAEVWAAVKQFSFPGAKANIQPVNGRTLINFKTNFYTEQGTFGPTNLQVGGATVQIRAIPTEYQWDFGDGSPKETTTTPGKKYPNLKVTHTYEKAGPVKPSVTIMYHIDWRFNGPWQPFQELLPAATSPATDLEVVESKARLGD